MATSPTSDLDFRPSYGAAAIVSASVLLLYLVTLAPSTAMWDTSEYITAAYTLGLPHPPGNPLFVLIGRVFTILPLGSNIAIRINVLAAICSAVSAGMWFLITERVLVGWFPHRWQRILGGTVAAVIGATAFTVWNQSVVNEKVYTVSLVGIAIISWLMIRWSDDPEGPKADRLLVVVAYLLGLGYSVHMGGFLAAPAVAVAVLVRQPRAILRWRLLAACAGALVFGITPFAIQPIRAAYNPPLNEGDPTACRGGLHLSCTFSKGTYDAFMYNFNRIQYAKPDLTDRQAPFTAQVGMWWFYFKWQWLRDAHLERQGLQATLAALFLVLGVLGGLVHYQRDRRSFWYFGSLMFTVSLALIYYLNFKYGASQAPELGDNVAREVRDRDYFFLWSFSPWGIWAGLGLMQIWEWIASLVGTDEVRVGRETVVVPRRNGLVASSPILALAIVPLFTNWSTAPRRGQTYTRDFAHDLLDSVEPYGVLVTVGDNDTFPLWYAQEVEGIRKDVVVAVTSLLNTDWYVRGIIRRPIYAYDEARGPAVYRGKTWLKPTTPPLRLTLAQADSIPPYALINQRQIFQKGDLSAIVDPRNLPQAGQGNGVLERSDLVVLRMIADAWPERSIYISRTSGNYARKLGLADNVLDQGLASKVFIPPKVSGRDTIYVRGGGWLDVIRTKDLWTSDFVGPESMIRVGDWIDRPSLVIPHVYIGIGAELSDVLAARGDERTATRVYETAKRLAEAVRLEGLAGSPPPSLQQTPRVTPGDSARATQLPR